ncbi:MAG: hypothetical protein ACRCVE_02145 [Plesiomonas sp.]
MNGDLAVKILRWASKHSVGVSSSTMASIAVGLDKPFYGSSFCHPWDPSDFYRCMILVEEVPEIRDYFDDISSKCKTFKPIIDHWDELVSMLMSEMRNGRDAPETYKRIKELIK